MALLIKHISLVLIYILLFTACEKGEETNRYYLTAAEKAFIPYSLNQQIPFTHSDGSKFNLEVVDVTNEFRQSLKYFPRDDYHSYEVKSVLLESSIPELRINLFIEANSYHPYVWIYFNDYQVSFVPAEESTMEMVKIGDQEFTDVYMVDYLFPDTTIVSPSEILYTAEDGIIQITMTNREAFWIQ